MRDASMRRNTSVKRPVRQAGVSNIDYLQSNKMPIKDSNINMDKKTKPMNKAAVLMSEWITNAQQYEPYARSMLMHPEIINTYVQLSLNKPVTPWKGVPEPEIIEEQSALLGFAKAYTIYPYGIEDDIIHG